MRGLGQRTQTPFSSKFTEKRKYGLYIIKKYKFFVVNIEFIDKFIYIISIIFQ